MLGLLKPFDLLLMDEVTTDLDVIVRHDLLAYLKKETEERNATIIYATHIFDGIGDWPTDLCHISFGKIKQINPIGHYTAELKEFQKHLLETEKTRSNMGIVRNSPLLNLVEKWLRNDVREMRDGEATKEPVLDRVQLRDQAGNDGDRFYNYWNHF